MGSCFKLLIFVISIQLLAVTSGWPFEPNRKFLSSSRPIRTRNEKVGQLSRFKRETEAEEISQTCCGTEPELTNAEEDLYQKCKKYLPAVNSTDDRDYIHGCYQECFAGHLGWLDKDGFIILEKYISGILYFYVEPELKDLVKIYGPECVKSANKQADDDPKDDDCNSAAGRANVCVSLVVDKHCPSGLKRKNTYCDRYFQEISGLKPQTS